MAILIPAIGSCVSRMTSGEGWLAERLEQKLDENYRKEGRASGDMAIICRDYATWTNAPMRYASANCRTKFASRQAISDAVNVLTMHACKGLEFPVVALSGLGQMPAAREDEHEEARLFYVAATRATQRLVITVSGDGGFGKRLCVTGLPENEPAARSVQSESKAKLPFNL